MKLRSSFLLSFSALAILLIFSACNTTVNITKRHYNSGFYVDISTKKSNVDQGKVQAKKAESTPVMTKVEDTRVQVVENSKPATESKKVGVVSESNSASNPVNKKEKVSGNIFSKPIALIQAIKVGESKIFTKSHSSRLETSQTSDEANRYLKLWLICLLASIVFSAIGIWILAALTWIAFLVFFILWLINL